MSEWRKTAKRLLVLVSISLLILFIVFVFNQFTQLYRNVATVNETAALVLISVLCFIIVATLTFSLIQFFRYPRVGKLPEDVHGEEYKKYIFDLYNRLRRNKILERHGFEWSGEVSTEEVERAYLTLDTYADEIIRKNGNSVFITTAISQNGVLDGIVVFVSLLRMMWNITIIYEGRPSASRMVYLYTKVAGVIFIARSVEDFDLIEEQIEPLIASIIGGSVLSLVPGSVQITNLIVNSLMEGSVNALLTTRVGIVTKNYVTALTNPSKKMLRRSASLQAAKMLGQIIRDNSVTIIKSFGRAAKRATRETAARYNPFGERG